MILVFEVDRMAISGVNLYLSRSNSTSANGLHVFVSTEQNGIGNCGRNLLNVLLRGTPSQRSASA